MIYLLLVGPDGNVEHQYASSRAFGRIQWNGRWYRSQHKAGTPHVYRRDADG